jgi:hypothetical protein
MGEGVRLTVGVAEGSRVWVAVMGIVRVGVTGGVAQAASSTVINKKNHLRMSLTITDVIQGINRRKVWELFHKSIVLTLSPYLVRSK